MSHSRRLSALQKRLVTLNEKISENLPDPKNWALLQAAKKERVHLNDQIYRVEQGATTA